MSKTDAIRAMKLARLEEQRRSAPAPAPKAAAAARAAAPKAAAPKAAAAQAPAPDARPADGGPETLLDLVPEALCGHTAISGRRCTRPQGHAEKNHRYAS